MALHNELIQQRITLLEQLRAAAPSGASGSTMQQACTVHNMPNCALLRKSHWQHMLCSTMLMAMVMLHLPEDTANVLPSFAAAVPVAHQACVNLRAYTFYFQCTYGC